MEKFYIVKPETPEEFEEYFDLRWRILRAPWNQSRGSEKDKWENIAEHISIRSKENLLLGVGRLHQINSEEAQIRYMAVEEGYRGLKIGLTIYEYLENYAKASDIKKIIVNARASATGFYERLGFKITGDGHTLYDEIQHKTMQKKI